jgi:large subunit ribosomal protein L5
MAQAKTSKQKYEEIQKDLMKELGIDNVMAAPRLHKIVINTGIGREYSTNTAVVKEMVEEIQAISGQKPVVTKSSKAISNFKLRENMDNGIKVTLRGGRMWDFYDKLVNVVLPRVKDFRGVSRKAFDGRGSYSVGIKEHTIFPEIDTSKMIKIRPLQVTIVTTARDDAQGFALLEKLGMPFKKK